MNYQAPKIEWQDQNKLDENRNETDVWHRSVGESIVHDYQIMESLTEINKIMVHYYNKQTKKGEPYISCPNFETVEQAKEWVEQVHYPSALVKAGFKPVSEPLSDIFDEILQWHEDACENPNYADEVVGRACMAEEFGEWCKSLTYFYEADILRKSAQDLYKSAEHIRATNYGERHFINRKAHLDSLIDLIWVAIQDGYRSGYDMKGALKELIRSNNSKRLPDGTFPRNEAGKIIKTSPTFTDVDLTEFI